MVTFLAVLLMSYTFRNLLGLLESIIMLRTSMRETNVFNSQNYSAGAIGIINLEKKHFLNFIADTMNCFPNLMLG